MPATTSERLLLFQACWRHAILRCPKCDRACRIYELAADFLVGKPERCWGCAMDLDDVIVRHLRHCRTAAAFASGVRTGSWSVSARSRRARGHLAEQRKKVRAALERADDTLNGLDERRRRRAG
jgi:hypothetical protein